MLIIQIALGIVLAVGILVLIKKINEKSELNRVTNYYSEQDRERMKWDFYAILIMLVLAFFIWFFSLFLSDYSINLVNRIAMYVALFFSVVVISFLIYVKIKESLVTKDDGEENLESKAMTELEIEKLIKGEVLPAVDNLYRKEMLKYLSEAGVDINTKQSTEKIDVEIEKWVNFIKKQNK